MATNEKTLRANVTILAAYPEAFANPNAPKAAELNDQFVYGTNEDAMVFNVSCGLLDDYTLNMEDPDTDDTLTVCDLGNVETPTFDNYSVEINALRDAEILDEGIYNMIFELFRSEGRPFILVKRIGKPNDAQFLTNGSDVVSLYGVETDFPVDVVEDNTMLQFGPRFKNTGFLVPNYLVVS